MSERMTWEAWKRLYKSLTEPQRQQLDRLADHFYEQRERSAVLCRVGGER